MSDPTLGEWGDAAVQAGANLGVANTHGLEAGAKAGALVLDQVIRRAVPSGRISGMGGAAVGGGFVMRTPEQAIVRTRGPADLLETGAKPHIERPRSVGLTEGGYRHALKLPKGFRYVVQHPGTRSRRLISGAVPDIVAAVTTEWAGVVVKQCWNQLARSDAKAISAAGG